jgi:hypothetical protein
MSPGQRAATVALSAAELAFTTAAVIDLARRPAWLVRGPKGLWWAALFVQPIGPIAYLAWGRGARATGRGPV